MYELVETRKMARLLLGHMTDFVASATAPHDRELPLIDADGPVFTGLIDADHPLDLIGRWRIAGQKGRTPLRHAAPPGISRAGGRCHSMPRACSHAATQQPSMTSDAS